MAIPRIAPPPTGKGAKLTRSSADFKEPAGLLDTVFRVLNYGTELTVKGKVPVFSQIAEGFFGGITDEERGQVKSFSELIELRDPLPEDAPTSARVGRFFQGFVADVLFDPVTFLTFGGAGTVRGLTKAGKVARGEKVAALAKKFPNLTKGELATIAVKELPKTPEFFKGGARFMGVEIPATRALFRGTSSGVKRMGMAMASQWPALGRGGKALRQTFSTKVDNLFEQVAKEKGINITQFSRLELMDSARPAMLAIQTGSLKGRIPVEDLRTFVKISERPVGTAIETSPFWKTLTTDESRRAAKLFDGFWDKYTDFIQRHAPEVDITDLGKRTRAMIDDTQRSIGRNMKKLNRRIEKAERAFAKELIGRGNKKLAAMTAESRVLGSAIKALQGVDVSKPISGNVRGSFSRFMRIAKGMDVIYKSASRDPRILAELEKSGINFAAATEVRALRDAIVKEARNLQMIQTGKAVTGKPQAKFLDQATALFERSEIPSGTLQVMTSSMRDAVERSGKLLTDIRKANAFIRDSVGVRNVSQAMARLAVLDVDIAQKFITDALKSDRALKRRLTKELGERFERAETVQARASELRDAIARIKEEGRVELTPGRKRKLVNKLIGTIEKDVGKLEDLEKALTQTPRYVVHALSREASSEAARLGTLATDTRSKLSYSFPEITKRREFFERTTGVDLTVEQANAIVRSQGTQLTGNKAFNVQRRRGLISRLWRHSEDIAPFFEDDPLRLMHIAVEGGSRVIGTNEFFRTIGHTLGFTKTEWAVRQILDTIPELPSSVKDAYEGLLSASRTKGERGVALNAFRQQFPDEAKRLAEITKTIPSRLKKLSHPATQSLLFEPEDIKDIGFALRVLAGDRVQGDMLHLFDVVNNYYKGSLTTIWPAFHGRNFLSNLYLNFIGGVRNFKAYRLATQYQSNWARGRNLKEIALETRGGEKLTFEGLGNELRSLGIISDAHLRSEIADDMGAEGVLSKFQFINPAGRRGPLFRWGQKVGSFVEGNARIAHYVDRRIKGDLPEDAARSVKKFLFDYGDLTPIERGVFKRTVLFYTFLRKNLPLQLQHAITKPGEVAGLYKLLKNAGSPVGRLDNEQDLLPDYLRDSPNIRLAPHSGMLRFYTGLGLPIDDLNRVPQPWSAGFWPTVRENFGLLRPELKFPMEQAFGASTFTGQPFVSSFYGTDVGVEVPEFFDKVLPESVKKAINLRKDRVGKRDRFVANARVVNLLHNLPLAGRGISVAKQWGKENRAFWERILAAGTGIRITEVDIAAARRRRRKAVRARRRQQRERQRR